MNRTTIIFLTMAAIIAAAAAAGADVERAERIERTFRFADDETGGHVIVDNVFGSIEVRGHDGDEVRVVVRKTITAGSDRRADRAETEVTLDITQRDDTIVLYVDGPFRERDGRGGGYRRAGYKVRYDFTLDVPRSCSIELETVNDGDIVVSSVDGDYEVSNVNGGVRMDAIGGTGGVYAVNGEVVVTYSRNPGRDCRAGTVNGDIRLYFQPDLSVDFYLRTMHGEAFTDFEVAALPSRTERSREVDGKSVFRVRHSTGIRAGGGGPEFELETLNGDMFILRK